jgi:hypothetical protein
MVFKLILASGADLVGAWREDNQLTENQMAEMEGLEIMVS